MFKLVVEFDETNPDGAIQCVTSHGDISPETAMRAMVRVSQHITARIEAAYKECPAFTTGEINGS